MYAQNPLISTRAIGVPLSMTPHAVELAAGRREAKMAAAEGRKGSAYSTVPHMVELAEARREAKAAATSGRIGLPISATPHMVELAMGRREAKAVSPNPSPTGGAGQTNDSDTEYIGESSVGDWTYQGLSLAQLIIDETPYVLDPYRPPMSVIEAEGEVASDEDLFGSDTDEISARLLFDMFFSKDQTARILAGMILGRLMSAGQMGRRGPIVSASASTVVSALEDFRTGKRSSR